VLLDTVFDCHGEVPELHMGDSATCPQSTGDGDEMPKLSFFRIAQDVLSKRSHNCPGISLRAIENSHVDMNLKFVIPFMVSGTNMVFRSRDTEITIHVSAQGVLSLFSCACDPGTCGTGGSACRECASTELILAKEVDNKLASGRSLCNGMDMTSIKSALGDRVKMIASSLKSGTNMVFEDVEEDLSFSMCKSPDQKVFLFCVDCDSSDMNHHNVCAKCEEYQKRVLITPTRERVMTVAVQPYAMLTRIRCVLDLWRTNRKIFMTVPFPRPTITLGSNSQLFLRLPVANSKLGNFCIYVQDYISKLGSNYSCECPTPLSTPAPARREYLCDMLVGILPVIAQAIAQPNIFVFDSCPLYNQFFKNQIHLKLTKLSDVAARTQFCANFSPVLLPFWSFLFDKNATVHMVIHSGAHFSNVIIGNINNFEGDGNLPYFAAIDCLRHHNCKNILHNIKR